MRKPLVATHRVLQQSLQPRDKRLKRIQPRAGQTRMTVSLCVIIMEMVKTNTVLPFVMVVIIVSKGVADRLGDSYVLRRIRLKNLPFLQRMPHLTHRRQLFSAASVVRLRDHPLLPECAPHDSCLPTMQSLSGFAGKRRRKLQSALHLRQELLAYKCAYRCPTAASPRP
jgi:hypothetical protein